MRQRYGTTRSLLLVFNVFIFIFALWSAARGRRLWERGAASLQFSAKTLDVIKPSLSWARVPASIDRESDALGDSFGRYAPYSQLGKARPCCGD